MTFFEEKIKPDIRELTLARGISYPSNSELVMLLLGSGTANRPIEKLACDVANVIEDTNPENYLEELLKIKGIGKTKALMIVAAIELGRRMNKSPLAKLRTPLDALPFIQQYALKSMEHFITISTNGAREILSIRVNAIGTGNMAVLRPREIYFEVVKENASGVIFCHNHPSGTLAPSPNDIELTNRLIRAADELGIIVMDHLIITKDGYFSFMEHGILKAE